MANADIADIVQLKLVPYGNTQSNGNGTYTCQHGTGECESDVLELCAMYKLGGDDISVISSGETSMAAWPFVLCMEEADGDPTQGEDCFSKTLGDSKVTWSSVEACAKDDVAQMQAAAATATPEHDYVPWCLVNGEVLEHTELLTKKICDSYTGTAPKSCKRLSEPSTDVCWNKK